MSGDYFGELALTSNKPRAASVIALEPFFSLSLDKD
jgi:CRP-like cAMP-binding protein